ncbi:MAG: T9SS type A sorting domain-containing protein [Bacteroidetes bacterium]|nr:MAG: T9SS type A sorting domain-containing protein [Bacteroidota bacterium]
MNLRLVLSLLAMGLYLNSHAQWVETPIDIKTGYYLSSVQALDSNTFIGHDGQSDFFITTDYGATFTKQTISFGALLGNLYHRSKDTGFFVDHFFYRIRFTTDAWQSDSNYIISDGIDTAFKFAYPWVYYELANGKAIALGDSSKGYLEAWWTEDNGNTWTRAANQAALLGGYKMELNYARIPKPWVSGDTFIVALPSKESYLPSLLLKTFNGGKDWIRHEIAPAYRFYRDLAFEDANRIIMSRSQFPGSTTIARSMDGGVTWDTSLKVLEYFQNITSVKNGNITLFFASGIGSGYSGDFGETWTTLDNLIHRGLYFYDANHGLSTMSKSQSNGGVRMFDGIFTGVKDVNSSSSLSLYPNPSRGNITLQSNQDGVFELRDNLGKVVGDYPVLFGENRMEIKLAPGVYFGQLIGTNQSVKILITN